jgi:hypothetical protein
MKRKMKRFAPYVALVAALILLGVSYKRQPTLSWEDHWERSAAFKYLEQKASSTAHTAWMVDSETKDEVIMEAGWDMGWRFERRFCVKVDKKNGAIFVEKYDTQGEFIWVPEDNSFSA